jgi:mercuric ion transport protein
LIALGFGAWIGNLTVLEPYRPIFIGAALVALFSPGGASTARRKPANRVRSARFPSASYLQAHFLDRAALVLVALGFPYVMPFFY